MPRWDIAPVQNDMNLHLLHMLEGTFLLGAAQFKKWNIVLHKNGPLKLVNTPLQNVFITFFFQLTPDKNHE